MPAAGSATFNRLPEAVIQNWRISPSARRSSKRRASTGRPAMVTVSAPPPVTVAVVGLRRTGQVDQRGGVDGADEVVAEDAPGAVPLAVDPGGGPDLDHVERAEEHSTNTYASETPVTDGQHVYTYFGMTGLHGVHVIVGMILISMLIKFWWQNKKVVTEDYIPTELIGLYWHFVDIVWIFLYPLFYLMPKPH